MITDGPPIFRRSPRLQRAVPQGEVDIPAPPPAPAAPHMSLAVALLYLLPGMVGMLVMYLVSRANGGHSLTYMAYSLPMLLMGGVIQLGLYLLQKERHRRAVADREQKYAALLERYSRELQQSRQQQQETMRQANPAPDECLARVQRLDARLWERSAADDDFLSVRLGVGQVPFAVAVKAPRSDNAIDPDPLILQARDLAHQVAWVDGVPICLSLPAAGVIGLAGPRAAALQAVRQVVLSLAVHHAPDEVKVAAVFPTAAAGDWAWLRWLPHTWDEARRQRFLAAEPEGAQHLLAGLYALLNRRKAQRSLKNAIAAGPSLPAYVVLLAAPRLTEGAPALPLLLREGPELGMYPLLLAERTEELSKECRGIVVVGPGVGDLIQTVPRLSRTAFIPDPVAPDWAERLARAMAPIRLHQISGAAAVPDRVTLLSLLGADRVEALDVADRWSACTPQVSLAVPIGLRAGSEPLMLDLHERGHGPHGLVAGTTGSGKSELLQTLVAGLAVSFHPHDLALVVVDYKGGGMANAFKGLPHVIGTLTNLDANLARRALVALKAELKRRQRLLGEAGVDHIDKYIRRRRQGEPLPPLPHLVLMVDEFAELKAEQPDFMPELISAVRVGRSLGLHLILATQKPAGVVDEQIWSNTKFRICLRVERPQDSQEVLKAPDAAGITGAGRAYLQVGTGEHLELFQAGWGGAPYRPGAAAAATVTGVAEVALDGSRLPLGPAPAQPCPAATRTELQVLVDHLCAVARRQGIEPVQGPWLPPLPPQVHLEQVRPHGEGWDGTGWRPAGTWLEPTVGLLDDPAHQRQEPLRIPLGREGHLLLFGAPGSGKTTLIQTLAVSLALTHSPADVHVYLVDGGGRSLARLGALPHVGAVVLGDEEERVQRLLRFLLAELEARKARLAAAGASTLAAYRSQTGATLPALVVLIDNYPAFAGAHGDGEEVLAQVAREGGSLGVHLVLTAGGPADVRARIANNITQAATLSLADPSQYSAVVGRTGGLEPAALPGRGLIRGNPPLEFQAALPVPGETDWQRSDALAALATALAQAWTGPLPPPVRVLPETVLLSDLIEAPGAGAGSAAAAAATAAVAAFPGYAATGAPLTAAVGLAVESLTPFRVALADGPHFVIAGPVEAGKTTLLQTWLLALAAAAPPAALSVWLVDLGEGGLGPLRQLPHVQAHITDGAGLASALDQIAERLAERRRLQAVARREAGTDRAGMGAGDALPALVVAIDDLDSCRDETAPGVRDRLEQMVRRDRGLGLHLLVTGPATAFTQTYDGLSKALRELQTGFLLGSTDHTDLTLFGLRLPPGEAGQVLPPGLGYYIRRGRYRKIKTATAHGDDGTPALWARRLADGQVDGSV